MEGNGSRLLDFCIYSSHFELPLLGSITIMNDRYVYIEVFWDINFVEPCDVRLERLTFSVAKTFIHRS